jgi:hypothetical protein
LDPVSRSCETSSTTWVFRSPKRLSEFAGAFGGWVGSILPGGPAGSLLNRPGLGTAARPGGHGAGS